MTIKDDFHIGKIEVKTNDFSKCLEYKFTDNYKKPCLMDYHFNNYDYIFYSDDSNYEYNDDIKLSVDPILSREMENEMRSYIDDLKRNDLCTNLRTVILLY